MKTPLLSISGLNVSFRTPSGDVQAIEDISFDLNAGETLAIVGESGSGKSVCSLAIMRLIAEPPGRISGSVRFEGRDLLHLSERQMQTIRGNQISMIFQEPMTSLNPVLRIGDQIGEVVEQHRSVDRHTARARALEMLELVQIPGAAQSLERYPHELSGGMRQRVMIAMALACSPKILIADEPTTALDVTIQAQVLDLLLGVRAELGTAILLITHDLGVVAEMAERVVVFYAGAIVEEASVRELLRAPRHPYTRGLLGAMPRLGKGRTGQRSRLTEIPGVVPPPGARGQGCSFAPRCPIAQSLCHERAPPLETSPGGGRAACWFAPP
jgi:peptide/nickel transport system ATP-binding protein